MARKRSLKQILAESRNRMEVNGKVTTMFIETDGQEVATLIDTDDIERVSQHRWSFGDSIKHGKKRRIKANKVGRLHRFIMKPPPGKLVDHANRDTLDNRKCNLRICTKKQNNRNRETTTDGYKGVRKVCGKWWAEVVADGVTYRRGPFLDRIVAAQAYNELVKEHHGKFAVPNEIEKEVKAFRKEMKRKYGNPLFGG